MRGEVRAPDGSWLATMLTETHHPSPVPCPIPLHPLLVEIIERGRALVVILDGEGRVHWGNQAFSDAVLGGRPAEGIPFRSLLEEESARLLDHVGHLGPEDQVALELSHPLAGGQRTIKYQLFALGGGLIAVLGTDRTEEMELVAQMSALVEDLHREIDRRTELSCELERMATTDFLTGVANRREFDKLIAEEWARMTRYQSQFALTLLDLDHFKEINDRFGHQVGDEVLKRVAEVLKAEVRSEDKLARYGGEEFAVIAIGASADNARELAERLRKRIAESPMPGGVTGLTITLGVAASSGLEEGAGLRALVGAADEALYRGKQNGRNRVEVHGQAPAV